MRKTIATLFSGFSGVDVGAHAAGLQSAWGIEYDAAIAEVGNYNLGNHIKVANILDCNPSDFERVDVLHASPPCPNFSVAKAGGKETALDLALASKVIEFITTLEPEIFTLENVWAYRQSKSWRMIEDALYKAGYWLHVDHVNCADHGVPQTRKRMIVRAVRGGFVPYMPEPVPWVGWYEAIEDLLPGLPDSQFAPWQLARLPEEIRTMLIAQGSYGEQLTTVDEADPAFTVTANHNMNNIRAFLMAGGGNTNFAEAYAGKGCRAAAEPSHTVTTITQGGGSMPKAFLIDFANAGRDATQLEPLEPSMVIQAWHGRRPSHYPAAFIVDGQNAGQTFGKTYRDEQEPVFTIPASDKGTPRASITNGRVVSMTPRCLARFQSFPDSYVLPEQKTLAAKGIGNAVPPLLMQRIYEGLII